MTTSTVDRVRLDYAARRFITSYVIEAAIDGEDVARRLRSQTGLLGGSCDEDEVGVKFFDSTRDGVSFHHLVRVDDDTAHDGYRVDRVEVDLIRWRDVADVIVRGVEAMGDKAPVRLAEWADAWRAYCADRGSAAGYSECTDMIRQLEDDVVDAGMGATTTVEQTALF